VSGDKTYSGGHWKGKGDNTTYMPSCHESHKSFEIGKGVLFGGSCRYPREGYDIYVGFDSWMEFQHQCYPWQLKKNKTIEFVYRISDCSVPKDKQESVQLVKWICEQLEKGKKVHLGCIGGHGRTGMIMAAIIKEMLGEKDAITWVRKHHCKKAVESSSQVGYLKKYFDITPQAPSKAYSSVNISGKGTTPVLYQDWGSKDWGRDPNKLHPVKTKLSIW